MLALVESKINTVDKKEFSENLLQDFFKFLDVSDKTSATYRRALKQLFKFFSENNISNPTHDDIFNFKKNLETAGKKAATIGLYLAAARRFFTWTEQRGIYPNITIGIKAPKQERGHKKDFFGASQLQKILSGIDRTTLQGKRDYAILSLVSNCGLRTVEVARADIQDLRNLGDHTVLYICGKGRHDKTEFVHIEEPVAEAIRDYLNARGTVEDTAPLFAGTCNRNNGKRLSVRTISYICKNSMINAGFNSKRLTAHSLRHTAVTLALMAGMRTDDVQNFARHSSFSTTQVYSHAVSRLNSQCEHVVAKMIWPQYYI